MKKYVYLIIFTLVTVICIIGGTCYHLVGWGVSFLSHLPFASFYSDSDDTESSGTTLSTGTVLLPSFNTVKIDSKVMNLSIEKGDDYSIQCDTTEKLNPKYEIKDNTLIVSQKQKIKVHNFMKNPKCSVHITIPEDTTLELINIDGATGDISLSNLDVTTLKIDNSVGDVKMDNCKIASIGIDTSTGDVKLNDCEANEIDVDTSVGDTVIKDNIFEKLYVDGSIGDVKVSSSKDLSDYAYDLDTSIGDVSINGVSHKKEYQQKGTGGKITVDNSTGDISITY
uniref:DUF4097 family beta strand repeat-containing protein n=1 Tax=Agathobacter sp. TaxID=2021311 RepID=UPI003FEE959D